MEKKLFSIQDITTARPASISPVAAIAGINIFFQDSGLPLPDGRYTVEIKSKFEVMKRMIQLMIATASTSFFVACGDGEPTTDNVDSTDTTTMVQPVEPTNVVVEEPTVLPEDSGMVAMNDSTDAPLATTEDVPE